MSNEVRLKISSPWVTYVNKLTALFDADPQIALNVDFNTKGDGPSVVISTNNGDKATALTKVLPEEKKFGNVTLKISVDGPFSNRAFTSAKELFDTLFEKSPVYAYSVCPSADGYWFVPITYVVFKNCVVQFFNDNLNDPHGVISTLYQDIAAELLEGFEGMNGGGVAYCTDVEVGKLGFPLGEWP